MKYTSFRFTRKVESENMKGKKSETLDRKREIKKRRKWNELG